MIQLIDYDIDDVDKFLEINELSKSNIDSQIMKKLLSVQDKISIIANIDTQELKAIVCDLKFIKYKFKDYIIEEGDISKDIFFILSGECQVFVHKKKVGEIKTGHTFGEAAAIFQTKRNATVVCSSKEVTLLSFSIDHNNMEFCAPALATLYKNLALQINDKLEEMNKRLTKK